MKVKIIGLTVSLVTASWLVWSETAAAAPKFGSNDTLNINIDKAQINAAGLAPLFGNLPTGEFNGGADGLADVLFGKIAPPQEATLSNRVLDVAPGVDTKPEAHGQFTVSTSSTDGFMPYIDTIGTITSFDGSVFDDLGEVNGGFLPPAIPSGTDDFPNSPPSNFFLKLGDVNSAVYFYLTGINSFNLGTALANGFGNLDATGYAVAVGDDTLVDFYRVDYQLSAPGLKDNGVGLDPVGGGGDGVTGIGPASAVSIIASMAPITTQSTPEPSTFLGLLAVAGTGLLTRRNKLKQK